MDYQKIKLNLEIIEISARNIKESAKMKKHYYLYPEIKTINQAIENVKIQVEKSAPKTKLVARREIY